MKHGNFIYMDVTNQSGGNMDNSAFAKCLPKHLFARSKKDLSQKIDNIIKYDSFAKSSDDLSECKQIIDTRMFEICCLYADGKKEFDTYPEFLRYTSACLRNSIIDFNRNRTVIRGPRNKTVQIKEVLESSFITEYHSLEDSPELEQRDFEQALNHLRENTPSELFNKEMELLYMNNVDELTPREVAIELGLSVGSVNRRMKNAKNDIKSIFEELKVRKADIFGE